MVVYPCARDKGLVRRCKVTKDENAPTTYLYVYGHISPLPPPDAWDGRKDRWRTGAIVHNRRTCVIQVEVGLHVALVVGLAVH